MKKINLEELKDKDLYLDDDGRIIVRNRVSNKKFMPSTGQYYFVSHEGRIYGHDCDNSIYDCILRDRDYVFKTKNDAKEYAKYLKALEKYRHNFTIDELKNPYTPKYQLHLYRDKIEYIGYGTVNGKIWFKSSNDCDLFIREVGIDNIKKFMFDIWE